MKVKITITGKVHDVGYRPFLLDLADSLFIQRFDARNVIIEGKQAVVVLVEGDEETVNQFIELVKSEKPVNAVVEKIEVEEYRGFVRSIDSYRQSLMVNQLNKIVQVGLKMLQKQDETIKIIREESKKTREYLAGVIKEESKKTREYLGGKVDKLGEKIDETREYLAGVIREESKETREYLGEKIDTAKGEIVREVRELRADLKTYLDERLRKIEDEINAIKSKLGMV
jgi:acylphosphatase